MRKVMYGYRRIRYLWRGTGVSIQPKTVIFETFSGRRYSDSPKAVYEFMKQDERYQEYSFIWIFKEPDKYRWMEDERTRLVRYQSKACEQALQQAKYWIFNYRALDHWVPKKGQIYVQCWHGVPLKRLGYDIKRSDNAMNSLEEIQVKYRWDTKRFQYLLSSCAFSSEKFRSAWNLKEFHKENAILEVGYPRNDFLINHTQEDIRRIQEKLGLSEVVAAGKKIILYAPTWRDNQHDASQGYVYRTAADFHKWRKQLGDEYILLFRAHYLVANSFDFEAYDGFVRDVSEVDDINELYVISDMLITDYSSVFFDYAILDRPILFYMYDLEQYRDEMRGFYLGLEELPGQIVQDEADVLTEILKQCPADDGSNSVVQHDEFNQRFNYLNDGKASERLVEEVIKLITPKPLILNFVSRYKISNLKLHMKAFCAIKVLNASIQVNDLDYFKIRLGDFAFNIEFSKKFRVPFLKGTILSRYKIEIPVDVLEHLDIQNKMIVEYMNYNGRVLFSIFDKKVGNGRNGKIFNWKNFSVYFRQSAMNSVYLTIRKKNKYDFIQGRLKIFCAYIVAAIIRKKKIILLFEKECQQYEESASVLYEKLIDEGYHNCFFILSQYHCAIKNLEKKYRDNLVYKDSFRHLVYFFQCKSFIGTETMGHVMQLRIANRYVVKKLQKGNFDYIFLQHGIMYMVSLDADARVGFRYQKYERYRVVVSSRLEANHFINLGGFKPDELYITGLAKFDKSFRYQEADRIVIMPTWRRWESNLAQSDFSATRYYQMLERMVSAIPDKLKSKIIVLPHPLMREAMCSSDCELKKYFPQEQSYNEVLKNCDILLTDYSSIAYDAFYRGSKVIFYWEEKEECMRMYGGNAHLMIDEDSAFGNVCWNVEELTSAIILNYGVNQTEKNKLRYKKIVEYHDGKNTERICEKLLQEQII